MRRIVSAVVPLAVVGAFALNGAGPAPNHARFDLVAVACGTCQPRVVDRGLSFAACQKTAYTRQDGSDDLTVLNPRLNPKHQCVPAQ